MRIRRTAKFHVATPWPELINKRIHRVELSIKEIHFGNDHNFFVAKGWLRRQIFYLESDGRLRRTEDRLQFEVELGEKIPEPFPPFKTDIWQQCLGFQPRQLGENQAYLEQDFELVVTSETLEPIPKKVGPLLLNRLIMKSQENVIISYPIEFKEAGIQPVNFHGEIVCELPRIPVVMGEISGVIDYRTDKGSFCEVDLHRSFSVLLKFPSIQLGQIIKVNGIVKSFHWILSQNPYIWSLELNVLFDWVLSELEDKYCVIRQEPQSEIPVSVLKTFQHLHGMTKEIPVTLEIPFISNNLFEINLNIKKHSEKIHKKGLFLSADVMVELFFDNGFDQEAHRCCSAEYNELLPIEDEDLLRNVSLLKVEPKIWLVHFNFQNGIMYLHVIARYEIKMYKSLRVEIPLRGDIPEEGEMVIGEILVGCKNFIIPGQTYVKLRYTPLKIDSTHLEFQKFSSFCAQEWIEIRGIGELTVSYLDFNKNSREDYFTFEIKQNFIWEASSIQGKTLIEPLLIHQSYYVNGLNITYHYLIQTAVELFLEKEINLQTIPMHSSKAKPSITENNHNPDGVNFKIGDMISTEKLSLGRGWHLEEEIPITLGNLHEMSADHTELVDLKIKNVVNAVLAEGCIRGEIEYWDKNGYLKRENVNHPFWKFLQKNNEFCHDIQTEIHPAVRKYSCFPVKTRAWSKGKIKIIIELELEK